MTHFTLPALTFRQMLTGTLVAAAKDDSTPQIHGVLMEVERGQLHMASTDRYRLAIATAQVFQPGAVDGSILMKYPNAVTLLKTIPTKPGYGETIDVRTVNGHVFGVSMGRPLEAPTWDCTFTAEEEEFPKWRTLVPSEPKETTEVAFDFALLGDIVKMPHDKKKPGTWFLNGPVRPCVMKWEFNDVDWTYLLMPTWMSK